MAPVLWPRLGRILWLACLLPLAPARVAAGVYELHLTPDGPATTGAEVTITASLVADDNGSLVLPASTRLYRFRWIHTPLLLTGKTDEAFSSTIRVVGNVPGDFPVSVWVTAADCGMCQPVARSVLVLPITEFLVGNLVVTQNTSLPWPSSYLTKTVLKVSFLLHDPSNFFKTASFLYSWDFGDGTQMVTKDATVYYNYSIVGSFTVKVKVVAEWEQVTPDVGKGVVQKTGDFSASLKLQETLRGIQVLGPTLIQTFQKMIVTLNFLGSPPLNVCWRLKPECLPLGEGECHPVSVGSTAYNLTHIFRDPGDYCFSIQAENIISKTHQYHKIQVWPSSIQPAVFAFPCATLITMMLAFIMYMTLRNAAHQKDMVEVADFDFSPMSDKNPEPPTGVRCCCQMCCGPFLLETPSEYLEVVRENHGLLPPLYKSVKTYTV
ncbi:PREDICTED: transmembrane protein 130 isoform X1 [Lipotes vexillifer]|uniref:Transmembrane protein 130 n=1 Tax=Lipotes vexillifer TaxID=118797 RepID=A0A340WMN9_LIPVE|nr:PREDICTED: transmembrane protein 130 isoform X1 [Lipotes vexillifer]